MSLTLLFLSYFAHSQDDFEPAVAKQGDFIPVFIVKTNLLATIISQNPFTGEARLMFEKPLSARDASVFSLSYVYANPIYRVTFKQAFDSLGLDVRVNGYRVQWAQKIYFTGNLRAPLGFYIGPHASYYTTKISPKGEKYVYATFNFFNVNLISGYQFTLYDMLAIDFYGGLGYRYNYVRERDGLGSPIITHKLEELDIWKFYNFPVKISLCINAGYAF
ncbi:MAG: hypothetical protein IIA45_13770 [Bacteroidetes bacterium]|nr:hypothetical protein [Bacteroidota bacterium]